MDRAFVYLSGTQYTKDATVKIELPKYPGIATDYHNIRFRDVNGSILPHWVEHDENGVATGNIWVKLPLIADNGAVIVIEWGNWNNGYGDIEGIALEGIGDDFEGTALNTMLWGYVKGSGGGSITVENGYVKLYPFKPGSGHNMCIIYSKRTLTNGFIVRELRKFTDEHYIACGLLTNLTFVNGTTPVYYSDDVYNFDMYTPIGGAGTQDVAIRKDVSGTRSTIAYKSLSSATSLDAFHISEYHYTSDGVLRYIHQPSTGENGWDFTATDTTFLSDPKYVALSQGKYYNGHGGISYIEWVFVRKYLNPEPMVELIMPSISHRFLTTLLGEAGVFKTVYLESVLRVGKYHEVFTQTEHRVGKEISNTVETEQRVGKDNLSMIETTQRVGKQNTNMIETTQRVGKQMEKTIETEQRIGKESDRTIETEHVIGHEVYVGNIQTEHRVGMEKEDCVETVQRVGRMKIYTIETEHRIGAQLQTTLETVQRIGKTGWISIETVQHVVGLKVLRTTARILDNKTNRVEWKGTISIEYTLEYLENNDEWKKIDPDEIRAYLETADRKLEQIIELPLKKKEEGKYIVFFEARDDVCQVGKAYYVSLYWKIMTQQEVERYLVVVVPDVK